ncbi:HD domain-containing protein [Oceanobacillus sp. Castelsardo]|uniref:HD domain-containing protein n=1 Tax=Oceanobacillus sp. Castelsardo TaxID=1851204 RepID=UPI0009EEAE2B|nr:HD domain-containing protein [Oceanobacillus sp. Castelsardo]
MKKDEQLNAIQQYVKGLFRMDVTGHDFYHMKRVANTAKFLAEYENADSFLCEAAAWLHDVGDHKLFQQPNQVREEMNLFLKTISMSDKEVETINAIIQNISFSKGNIPETLEGRIVQDADRLDAIGAVGIARTFAYGGANSQFIYNENPQKTSIQHFYDKLLHLKDKMNTEKAKQMATDRHQFMEQFLDQFHKEWS